MGSKIIDPQTILGIGSAGIGAFIRVMVQSKKDQHELMMGALKLENKIANDANNRGSAWGRRFALILVLSVAFGGLFYAAHYNIKVSQIIETKPIVDLFGLIKLGGGQKVVEANGFVIPQYVENSVVSIIFFLFGSSVAKR